MRLISDPLEVFNVFAHAYRDLRPAVLVSVEVHAAVEDIIDDILCGREIAAFKMDEPFEQLSKKSGPRVLLCSSHFLEFLHMLEQAMKEQLEFRVAPERAIELLYNNDVADVEWTQPLLRLNGSSRKAQLTSVQAYEDILGGPIAFTLFELNDATDWTLI